MAGFDCEQVADILIISITGESFICGAAHGSLWQKTHHFDLDTGKTINVTDLFQPEIDYEHDLGIIILQHCKNRNAYNNEYDSYYDNESNLVKWIGDWKVRKDGLQIYYMPYMGPAPGGNIESVIIPYREIEPLINKENLLWQRLDDICKDTSIRNVTQWLRFIREKRFPRALSQKYYGLPKLQ